MSYLPPDVLNLLQQNTSNIRNLCILAHVDHGKTTLTDFLLSSNGLLSAKLAGKVRFMDSRVDEQERQITMKSSSIALVYRTPSPPRWQRPIDETESELQVAETTVKRPSAKDLYLVNVIDSPGHVDFSSEVASALRVSDGALVLVDVVEGFSVQTQAVLQQAWREGVSPCLVLSKMDRLFTEMKLTPAEAYRHCSKIIEGANAVVATFLTADAMVASYNASMKEQQSQTQTVENENEKEPVEEVKDSKDPDVDAEKKDKKDKKKRDKKEKSSDKSGEKKDKKDKKDKKSKKEKSEENEGEVTEEDIHAILAQRRAETLASITASVPTSTDEGHKYAVDIDDSKQWRFDPILGNVAFTSSWDSWGFTLPQFASIHAKRLGLSTEEMLQCLWGDYYIVPTEDNEQEERVTTHCPEVSDDIAMACHDDPLLSSPDESLFVKLIMRPVWELYHHKTLIEEASYSSELTRSAIDDLDHWVEKNRLDWPNWKFEMRQKDPRTRLQTIFAQWLPISECLLSMAVKVLPSPITAQATRMEQILPGLYKYLANSSTNSKHDAIAIAPSTSGSVAQIQSAKPTAQSASAKVESVEVEEVSTGESLTEIDLRRAKTLAQGVFSCDRKCSEVLAYVVKVVDLSALGVRKTVSAPIITPAVAPVSGNTDASATTIPPAGVRNPARPVFTRPGGPGARPPVAKPGTSTTATDSTSASTNADAIRAQALARSQAQSGGDSTTAALVVNHPPQQGPPPRFMAVARIFAGSLSSDGIDLSSGAMTVFGPKYVHTKSENDTRTNEDGQDGISAHVTTLAASSLRFFVLMGRDFEPISHAFAGNVVGFTGIDDIVFKFFTFGSVPRCPAFRPLVFQAAPIVQVVVEPENALHSAEFAHALELLDKIDPNVIVGTNDQGERFIAGSGELHIERCLRDLQDSLFVGKPVRVHPPSVGFRETVLSSEDFQFYPNLLSLAMLEGDRRATRVAERLIKHDKSDKSGKMEGEDNDDEIADADATGPVVSMQTENGLCGFRVRALPLPQSVTDFLEAHKDLIRRLRGLVESARSLLRRRLQILFARVTDQPEDVIENLEVLLWQAENQEKAKYKNKNKSNKSKSTTASAITDQNQDQKSGGVEDVAKSTSISSLSSEEENFFVKLRSLFVEAYAQEDAAANCQTESSTHMHMHSISSVLGSTSTRLDIHSLFASGDVVDYIWCFGPKSCGPNILINTSVNLSMPTSITAALEIPGVWSAAYETLRAPVDSLLERSPETFSSRTYGNLLENLDDMYQFARSAMHSMEQGFQLTASQGPLSGEPMMGVCFVIEDAHYEAWNAQLQGPDPFGPVTGQLLSAVKDACAYAFSLRPQRLMEAFFRVEMQFSGNVFRDIANVVARRRGRVSTETVAIEGTPFFTMGVVLPVQTSFGFAADLRKQTGGVSNPQLFFSHWEVVPMDPFYVPTTLEEIEEHGIEDTSRNLAKDIIVSIRKRKGLLVDEKVVEAPEKQRTRAKKK